MAKLLAIEKRWAINGRGRKIDCPVYAVMVAGVKVGEVSSFLRDYGKLGWTAKNTPDHEHFTRKEAVAALLKHVANCLEDHDGDV